MKLLIDIPYEAYYTFKCDLSKGNLNALAEIVAKGEPYIEPQKGEWIKGGKDVTGQYFQDEFICNKCFTVVNDKSNFCPNCGADMRGEEK